MIKKLRLGTSIAALILFALPWIDVRCSDQSMFTQSGFQTIYGGASLSEGMKGLANDGASDSDEVESLGAAPLVALALLAVIGAAAFSAVALFRGGESARMLSTSLPAVALGLLLLQLMVGFPAKKTITSQMSEGQSEMDRAAAMMMNIQVKTLPAFYFQLLLLAVPTAMLANGLIDRHRKKDNDGPVA